MDLANKRFDLNTMNPITTVLNEFNLVTLAANQPVFGQGQSCENGLVVVSGLVKVYARSRDGKELVLYRIREGETCVLTNACLLGNSPYPAEAITETEVVARVIPRQRYLTLIAENESFRDFVFQSFSARLTDLMFKIESLALASIDQRIICFLLDNADQQGVISSTHEQIAIEIGSAREVVSRHLKALEKQNMLALRRGTIELIAPDMLQKRKDDAM